MNDSLLIEKLYEMSGPIIRWRIVNELMDIHSSDKNELLQAAVNHQEVQQYIQYFIEGANQGRFYFFPKMIHGSKPEQLENTTYKLWSMGMGKGVSKIERHIKKYIPIMEYDFYRKDVARVGYGVYQMAQSLGLLGFAGESSIFPILQKRLDQLYHFVQQERFDIYVSVKGYPRLPSNWKDVEKIIDPVLTKYGDADGEPPLPSVYDILGMLGMKQIGMSQENENKANAVLQYCFDERYQLGISPGYGILLAPTGQYYGMGWSVHLPGYGKQLDENVDIKQLLFWADVLCCFSASRGLELIKDQLNYFDKYRLDDGFYCFPKEFIPNEKSGYFIMGKGMGLGENRKRKEAFALESTFRVLRIKKNLGLLTI